MVQTEFVDPIEYELSKERAGALGRVGRQLETAVREYRELDSPHARDEKLWELAELVTFLLVQREACGLRNADYVLRFYDVPAEAVRRMGVRRPR